MKVLAHKVVLVSVKCPFFFDILTLFSLFTLFDQQYIGTTLMHCPINLPLKKSMTASLIKSSNFRVGRWGGQLPNRVRGASALRAREFIRTANTINQPILSGSSRIIIVSTSQLRLPLLSGLYQCPIGSDIIFASFFPS